MAKDAKKGSRWTRIPIITKRRHIPIIIVDCSGWGQHMEVALSTNCEQSAPAQSRLVNKLVKTIDVLDKAQKGSGFRKIDVETAGHEMVVALAPIEPERARERVANICASLSQADHPLNKIKCL